MTKDGVLAVFREIQVYWTGCDWPFGKLLPAWQERLDGIDDDIAFAAIRKIAASRDRKQQFPPPLAEVIEYATPLQRRRDEAIRSEQQRERQAADRAAMRAEWPKENQDLYNERMGRHA